MFKSGDKVWVYVRGYVAGIREKPASVIFNHYAGDGICNVDYEDCPDCYVSKEHIHPFDVDVMKIFREDVNRGIKYFENQIIRYKEMISED